MIVLALHGLIGLAQDIELLTSIHESKDKAEEFLKRWPEDPDHLKALQMIDNKLWGEPYLDQLVRDIRKRYFKGILSKSHICIPKSSRFFIIADPSGLLDQGEMFLQCDTQIITGVVLITRNPCYHPGDVRKLRGALPRRLLSLIVLIHIRRGGVA